MYHIIIHAMLIINDWYIWLAEYINDYLWINVISNYRRLCWNVAAMLSIFSRFFPLILCCLEIRICLLVTNKFSNLLPLEKCSICKLNQEKEECLDISITIKNINQYSKTCQWWKQYSDEFYQWILMLLFIDNNIVYIEKYTIKMINKKIV